MVFLAEQIDWQSNAGRLIDRLVASLPAKPRLEITVFGSAPLQLLIERSFVSADIDLFTAEAEAAWLKDHIRAEGLSEGQTDFHFQVCDPLTFQSTFDWRSRALEVERRGHLMRIVHPWDVLVSKLQRLEEKDLAAFRLTISKTGHPTEPEFRRHLQKAVDLYRPRFAEETQRGDMIANTRELWSTLWGRPIDPRAEIIRPAIERVNRAHSDFDPTLKTKLSAVGGDRVSL